MCRATTPKPSFDEGQIVLAAEITNNPTDFSQLDPMITTALLELEQAGVTERPRVALADAGYDA